MALAGSNGGSWTTTYGKSRAKAAEVNETEASRRNLVFSPNLNSVSIQQPTICPPAPVTGDILNFITGLFIWVITMAMLKNIVLKLSDVLHSGVQKGGNTILMESNNDGKRKP